jgi:8-oxo-dGTP pyrophosphatase MutT (NUDIX family)
MAKSSNRKAAQEGKVERRQVGALPVRMHEGVEEVCLITTRETRRWTIPKGWPMKGLKDHLAAAVEAEQEAGLYGKVNKRPIGSFLYRKRLETKVDLVRVTVFRLDVEGSHPSWRERDQREVRWFERGEAARMVEEPDLAALLKDEGERSVDPAASDSQQPWA